MSKEIDGLDELVDELDSVAERAEKARLAIESSEGDANPVQKIREDLLLNDSPRQVPMIQASSEEEANAKIDEAGGIDKYIEAEWLVEDLGDYIVGE